MRRASLSASERELDPFLGLGIEADDHVGLLSAHPDVVVLLVHHHRIGPDHAGGRREDRHLLGLVIDLHELAGLPQAGPEVAIGGPFAGGGRAARVTVNLQEVSEPINSVALGRLGPRGRIGASATDGCRQRMRSLSLSACVKGAIWCYIRAVADNEIRTPTPAIHVR